MRLMRTLKILLLIIFVSGLPINAAQAIGFTEQDLSDSISNLEYYNSVQTDCSITGVGSVPVSSTLPATVPEPHRTLFAQAASAFNTNPQYLAALFLDENGNIWKNFDTVWPTSGAGAIGPMQFLQTTWGAYGVDGNNDGTADIRNIFDAVHSAANMAAKNGIRTDSPLGDINAPFRRADPKTMLFGAAQYNWGPGNVDRRTTDTTSIDDPNVGNEAREYVKNTYAVISSGFTKSGKAGYGDPRPDGAPSNGGSSGLATSPSQNCSTSNGVVAGNLVATALNLAWDTREGHGKNKEDAKPSYQDAMPLYNGSTGDDPFSDCGVFVATVMIASKADPTYPKRGTANQLAYVRSHPEKYTLLENVTNTSQLSPGDIFIYNDLGGGHTIIYTGPLANGYNAVDASWHDHVPQVRKINVIDAKYTIARLK